MQASRNRSRKVLNIIRSANAGRAFLAQTGIAALNGGKEPDRVDRQFPFMNGGLIGNKVDGWPYDGSSLFIPHQQIPRRPQTAQNFGRIIDTGVTIPAIYVDQPVG